MLRDSFVETKLNLKKVNRRLFLFNAIALILFFLIQILSTSVIGTKTQEIDNTRFEKSELRQDNSFLEAEIAKAKSYNSANNVIKDYSLEVKNVNHLESLSDNDVALKFN